MDSLTNKVDYISAGAHEISVKILAWRAGLQVFQRSGQHIFSSELRDFFLSIWFGNRLALPGKLLGVAGGIDIFFSAWHDQLSCHILGVCPDSLRWVVIE